MCLFAELFGFLVMLVDLFDCRRGTGVLSIDPGNLDIWTGSLVILWILPFISVFKIIMLVAYCYNITVKGH